MARQYFINGETMITVKSAVTSTIPVATQLGLSQDAISVTENYMHDDIGVDAYGNTPSPNPPDLQVFGAQAILQINLVHYDPLVLQECIRLSMGGQNGGAPVVEGQLARAGTLMGGNVALYAANNNYISIGLSSPVGGIPWRFYACYLAERPIVYPLGTKRSVVACVWRAIAYSVDPWNGGTGSAGVALYDHGVLT